MPLLREGLLKAEEKSHRNKSRDRKVDCTPTRQFQEHKTQARQVGTAMNSIAMTACSLAMLARSWRSRIIASGNTVSPEEANPRSPRNKRRTWTL